MRRMAITMADILKGDNLKRRWYLELRLTRMKRVRVRVRREKGLGKKRERSPGPGRQNRCLNGVALFPSSQYLFIAPFTCYKFQFSIINLIIYESTPHILRSDHFGTVKMFSIIVYTYKMLFFFFFLLNIRCIF